MSESNISVVICTKDRPDMLRRCLASILESKSLPGEVLVVDQSIDDKTAAVVQDISPESRNLINYMHLDSVGITVARNTGVEASRGKIIAFTDDDCMVKNDWLHAIELEFRDPSVNCVCGHTLPADHGDRPKQALISTLNHNPRKMLSGKCNPILIGRGNNMAFRKADLQKLGGFNEQIGVGTSVFAGDDFDLLYRLLDVGGTIVHSPDAVVLHSQPDDWEAIIRKKRGYSISTAAVLIGRAKRGDMYAGLLLTGKILYEFVYLLGGNLLHGRWRMASVGWHSLIGSLSGLKYFLNNSFCDEVHRLSVNARKSYGLK